MLEGMAQGAYSGLEGCLGWPGPPQDSQRVFLAPFPGCSRLLLLNEGRRRPSHSGTLSCLGARSPSARSLARSIFLLAIVSMRFTALSESWYFADRSRTP